MNVRRLTVPVIMVFLVGLSVAGLAFGQGSTTKEDVQKQVQQAAETVRAYSAEQIEAYKKEMQGKLDELSKKTDELRKKAETAKGEAAAKYQSMIADLKNQTEATKKKLQELGSAGSAAWDQVRQGFDKALGDLQKAYEDAASKFK
jgi:uncharacterized coiled-coil DUF342 family protein